MFELVDKTTNKLHKINIDEECSKAGESLPFNEWCIAQHEFIKKARKLRSNQDAKDYNTPKKSYNYTSD